MSSKVISFFLLISLISCSKLRDSKYLKNTSIEFENPHRRYNPLLQGTTLDMSYKFKNTGENPLVISEIQTSCGCVLVKHSKESIAPGNVGYINLKFDSSKNLGYVKQYVNIFANVDSTFSKNISFELNVIPDSHHIKDYEEVYFSDEEIKNHSKSYVPIK